MPPNQVAGLACPTTVLVTLTPGDGPMFLVTMTILGVVLTVMIGMDIHRARRAIRDNDFLRYP